MTSSPLDIFSDHRAWADMTAWRQAAVEVHARGPIHRVERPGYDPFWAVVDHAAIQTIARQPKLFTNQPEVVLASQQVIAKRPFDVNSLVHMDAPEHAKYRKLVSDWFKPGSLTRLAGRIDTLGQQALARMEAAGGECDFAVDVALPYPLQVILEILGLPEADYPLMSRLTQEFFGQEDPDLRRGAISTNVVKATMQEMLAYFGRLTAERQARPTEDLATLIANGKIDGDPMPDAQRLSFYMIIATAGHDTTAYAISGGMLSLLEHPDQLALLQQRPDLLENGIEEMLRFSAPARHFMRTASEDTEVAGQEIRKGDWLYLSYPAANLDPSVFEDPLRFDVERVNANRQLSFGYGVHFCLGAPLARMELRSLFGKLLSRIESIELAGEAAHTSTTVVGGVKRLPVRFSMRA